MDFLTLDKNFVLDNFNFVQDKNFFVRADGRGNSHHQNKNFTCKARRDNPPPYNINLKPKFHGFEVHALDTLPHK